VYLIIARQRWAVARIMYQSPVMDLRTLDNDVATLREYTQSLMTLLMSNTLPARKSVLCFDWAFSGETKNPPKEVETFDKMMDMRSACVAFEYMCVSISAAIFTFRASKLAHDKFGGDSPEVARRYTETVEYLEELQRNRSVIASPWQQSTLRSQGMPIQVQERWTHFFCAHVRYKLACCNPSTHVHAVKVAAYHYLEAAREWLVSPDISLSQIPVAQCAYDATIVFYTCQNIRWHCYEAEEAEKQNQPSVGYAIIQRAFMLIDHLTTGQKESMRVVIDQCEMTREVLSKMCPASASDELMDMWLTQRHEARYCQ